MILDYAFLNQGFHINRFPLLARAQFDGVQGLIFIPFIGTPKLAAREALQ